MFHDSGVPEQGLGLRLLLPAQASLVGKERETCYKDG